eukprot:TRINITY_DN34563_c0_g1_i1.p1 TRINITY_DN34563_c0_g1~~TRINITY_DN34563_c0_g1_i1.p1  ORF type:complete len:424 (+),score=54.81 TRINITY_DN34563_c0_g1_i1:134-1405(+)
MGGGASCLKSREQKQITKADVWTLQSQMQDAIVKAALRAPDESPSPPPPTPAPPAGPKQNRRGWNGRAAKQIVREKRSRCETIYEECSESSSAEYDQSSFKTISDISDRPQDDFEVLQAREKSLSPSRVQLALAPQAPQMPRPFKHRLRPRQAVAVQCSRDTDLGFISNSSIDRGHDGFNASDTAIDITYRELEAEKVLASEKGIVDSTEVWISDRSSQSFGSSSASIESLVDESLELVARSSSFSTRQRRRQRLNDTGKSRGHALGLESMFDLERRVQSATLESNGLTHVVDCQRNGPSQRLNSRPFVRGSSSSRQGSEGGSAVGSSKENCEIQDEGPVKYPMKLHSDESFEFPEDRVSPFERRLNAASFRSAPIARQASASKPPGFDSQALPVLVQPSPAHQRLDARSFRSIPVSARVRGS